MKSFAFASLFCMAVGGMADSSCYCEPSFSVVPFEPQNGYGVGIEGDFLYWLPNIDNVEASVKYSGENNRFAHVEELHFKYQPGFRISADVHSDCRGFLLQASWTSFYPNAERNAAIAFGEGLISLYGHTATLVTGFSATSSHQRWEMKYDMVDLFLEPPFFSYKSFSFTPFIGVRGGRIDQPVHVNFEGNFLALNSPASSIIDIDQKFWCVGATSGMNAAWDIGAGFSFFGNFLASLVYGHFKISEEYLIEAPAAATTLIGFYEDHSTRFRPNFQAAFGFNWDYSWCEYAFSLSAAYEMVLWLNQNQFIASTTEDGGPSGFVAAPTRFKGDLGMGGLSVSAGLEF
ncbi:MAG: hypothetical protein K1X28_05720 [Parachlamydiales bacterium]|nr:hypothetical protein [Parachlamydiales bacterium]